MRFSTGDLIGVEGYLFRTRTGELSVHAEKLTFLSKILLALPEKFHGLEDVEVRYRQRYLDLIANPESQKVFVTRAKIIASLRRQLEQHGFIEVETPMMQPLYGGATARPFVTHHNTLDMDLFLRIAPELYLKRLIVGGLDRVYEINRNFRNEGISTHHNPEFTMLEFYQAYTDYQGLMDLSAELLKQTAIDATGSAVVEYQGETLDFSNIRRMSMQEAVGDSSLKGHSLVEKFEREVEPKLIQPTFIYDYPVEVSPLSKNKRERSRIRRAFRNLRRGHGDRQRVHGVERSRGTAPPFRNAVPDREAGDEEAHQMDEDYLRAMSYGMPPTGGEGIGVDRLTMILTNSRSIRDVILFPLMRPEGARASSAGARMTARSGPCWLPATGYWLLLVFEFFIARRYLRAKRKQVVISVITFISVVGVAAGVMALVIALAVENGFKSTLERNLLGATAHVSVLEKEQGEGIEDWEQLAQKLAKLPHVVSATPGLYESAYIKGPVQGDGAEIKGVKIAPGIAVPDALKHLKAGSVDGLLANEGELPGIMLGSRLAQRSAR